MNNNIETIIQEQKNTPKWVIVLIIVLCAVLGIGGWYIGKKMATKENDNSKEEKKEERLTPPEKVDKKTLSCSESEENFIFSMNFNYEGETLVSGDAKYVFDFTEYAKDQTTFTALKANKMCEQESILELSNYLENCTESWDEKGMLTMTFTLIPSGLAEEYGDLSIETLKNNITSEGGTCTIK